MTRLELLNRIVTSAALIALAVILGIWLSRPPLTAAPVSIQSGQAEQSDRP